ncbi:MAG: zinc ribbon domain-containing protein [Oscillospiraceae bacterium]|nr:zinc ribbon domain-containing protein [Oscillospiraceae bacterium]
MSTICQSCTMPLTSEKAHGTNADGSPSPDYCHHCYQNGQFTDDLMIEQMIERCVPFLAHQMGADKARAMLAEKLPTLKRWGGNHYDKREL